MSSKKDLGWIRLFRKVTQSTIWDTAEPYDRRSAWIDLLLSVNHEDRDIIVGNQMITVHRGQRFTSVRKLAERWNWGNNKALAYLRLLVSLQMIEKSSTHGGTLLTIVNYDLYQPKQNTGRNANKDTNEDASGT